MAHYALLDENNIVKNVLYVDNTTILDENGNESEELGIECCRIGLDDPNAKLVRTSYTGSIRRRYAGVGYLYSEEYDAFIPSKINPSWVFNETTLDWEPPIPQPQVQPGEKGSYLWDENTVSWVFIDTSATTIIDFDFRSQLSLTEKILWDNPDTASTPTQKAVLTTFKQELPLTIGEQETTELLDLLVSEGVYTQQRLDEIISNL